MAAHPRPEPQQARGDSFFVNLSCATNMTVGRTRFLEDRYRECVGAGGMDIRLDG